MKPLLIISAICFTSFLLLAACTAVPQPTATPEAITNLVQERPSATTTPTAIPTTAVAVKPTRTPKPTKTPRPTNVPTGTFTPSPTATQFAWHPDVTEIIKAERVEDLVWSPTRNEFASYQGCGGGREDKVYLTNILQTEKVDVTLPDFTPCYATLLWHPSGEYFLFSSESQENWREIAGWQVDRSSLAINKLDWADYYWGWLNDDLQITQKWTSSDTYFISIFNVDTKESVSYVSFAGKVMDVSKNYVILNESFAGTYDSSAAIFAQYEISPDIPLGYGDENIKLLGRTQEIEWVRWGYLFYSRAMDILPSSDKILVLTWETGLSEPVMPQEVLTGTFPTNIQLWEIDSDELTFIKEGGIYGRFSPSGNELVTLTASLDSPQLEFINRLTNDTIIAQPAYAESDKYPIEVEAYTSFSPNGRFLTYYSPEQDLIVYDIALGIFLPSVTAVAFTPVWSPDNGRFVYQDRDNGLSIYEIDSQTTYSLTQTSCNELYNPQWSFDGSYLSVSVPCAGTAVLQLP